ncbi:protein-tyrosine phosphatase, partial [Zopfochytrium polystomum]
MSATATPSAATTTKVLLTSAPRTSSLPPLFPPFRFSAVQEDLFRGSYPKPRNHRFLRRLRLRTILSLTPDPATPELRSLAEASGITLVHIRVDKPKEDSIPLSFSRCSAILQVLTDASRLPLYVHCLDGCLVTGLVILALRKLQLWTISSAITEYTRFLGGEELVAGKEVWEFIERFSGEVEL